ncbi:3-ketosteroid reductase [Acephala macrosclerotiorum]|nr:3-ketosteroid reductase [Acephala macrosclerotiorum]
MGLPPWETSDSQLFALITGANSGLGYSIAARMIDEFITTPTASPKGHLILILCTRSPMKTRFTISRLRAHLRKQADYSPYAARQRAKAKEQGTEYRWEATVQRIHFLGVEADLCDLRTVYALADKLVNGTVGSPDATTMDGGKLPHGSPGTQSYSENIQQDTWALSQKPGSIGAQRSWGWGLSGLRIPRLDAVILTAGIGGWKNGYSGLDWPLAIRAVLFDTIEAVTWPRYKLADLGAVVKSQLSSYTTEETQPLLNNQDKQEEPPLGSVFCSNVFGHYVLAHELMPLLSQPAASSSKVGGKIIWVSSIEALDEHFSLDDMQGLKSSAPYESSKRLIDLVALSSELPSVQRISAPYFDPSNTLAASKATEPTTNVSFLRPKMYLTHPGIFASDIMPLPSFLVFIYKLVFFFVRWIGSPWHPIDPYKAAVAPTWIALSNPDELEDIEGHGLAKNKYGSATDTSGAERVLKTEVPGWGWNGKVGEIDDEKRKGRKRATPDATKESREDFEILGGKCWTQMEELRKEWEGVLGVKNGKSQDR